MASQVDTELKGCIKQFNDVRSKYRALKKTQREEAEREAQKVSSIEPNMVVMETWLKKSRWNEELFKKIHSVRENSTGAQRDYLHLSRRDAFEDDELKAVQGYGSQQNIHNALKNPDVCTFANINQIYRNSLPDKLRAEQYIKPHGCAQPNSQQEFMMDFVEATYNLFQLQNKRIDELMALLVEGGEA